VTRTRRLLAGVAALLSVSVVATGCDSSPFAASINGQVIRQTALNAELRQFAGNAEYVTLVKQGVVSAPVTVAGTGTGTYTSTWTASVLSRMILAAAVHQRLERSHHLPSPAQYAATRAVDSVLYGPGAWDAFSAAFRTTIVGQDADLATYEPDTVSTAQLQGAEAEYSTQLFSNVCVRTVAVFVNGANGQVDFAASLAAAQAVAARIQASPSTASGGSLTCYSAAALETEPLPFVLSVLDLKTGTAGAPQKTADGYTVTAVTSRTQIPVSSELGRAFSVAVNQNQHLTTPASSALLGQTRVKVNPLYGTWKSGSRGAYAVVPPVAPSGGVTT
jgi:hypothetical protein